MSKPSNSESKKELAQSQQNDHLPAETRRGCMGLFDDSWMEPTIFGI